MKKVATGEVTQSYTIYEHEMEDGLVVYDWITSTGAESGEFHETVDDAIRDVESHYGA